MKTSFLILLGLLLSSLQLLAQTDNVTLLAQSADGKAVKLFWFVKKWSSDITGFDVKRKDGQHNWTKLNPEPVLPGISGKKKLAASGANLYDQSLLKAKLYKLTTSHRIMETDYTHYLQKLNNDDNTLQEISAMMADDYDIAMLNGFGYIDHATAPGMTYEYGLFVQGTDRLLAKTSWKYGDVPDLDVIRELTSKGNADNRGVKVMWIVDTMRMKAAHVAGFNIYREGIRLNTSRITMEDDRDPALFTWYDKYANSAGPVTYGIASESIFDVEGIIKSYFYLPAEHPKEYKKAEVNDIASIGYYFKDGTNIKWNFPKEYEHFIKGFKVEKMNMPGVYSEVSGLLDPATRTFTDKTQSQVNGYIKARVKTIYKDRSEIAGTERIYCYFPVNEPPPPQNVVVKSTPDERSVTANISWDSPMAGDTITESYKVYAFDDGSNKFVAVSEEPLRANHFAYVIKHGTAGIRRFCVTAVNKSKTESPNSDTVMVIVPSLELPQPVIKRVVPDMYSKATIEWQYPEIADLKGFRLTQDGKEIATENELKKGAREFVTGKLEEGASYEFTISAVSDKGIVSPNSASFHVVVTETSKK